MPKIIIPCCDASLPVVKINSFLFDKFWPEAIVHYLGFSAPEYDFYNNNHKFYSLAPEQTGGASGWTRHIHKHVKDMTDEFVIFSLDDFLLCEKPNIGMINIALKLMTKNKNIGRFDLTFDSQVEGNCLEVGSISSHNIVTKHPRAPYRISTQPAVWDREFLLQFLDNDWNPWEFEIKGTYEASSQAMPQQTMAFSDTDMATYPVRTVAKGAVSRHNPGKFNVLGLHTSTIKELVAEGFFKEEDAIWGQHADSPPGFFEKGGYNFHPGFLDFHPTSKTGFKEYHSVYDDPEFPMLTVNLWDASFSHTLTHPDFGYISTQAEKSPRGKKIRFLSRLQKYHDDCGVTIFTDRFLDRDAIRSVDSKIKIGWILEPPVVHPWAYEKIDSYIEELDYLFTFSEEVTSKYSKARTFSWCSIRLDHNDWGVHEKNKLCSMIASDKKWAPGHQLRHQVATDLSRKHGIELWGRGFKEFPQHGKILSLKDYMFSIVIQNCQLDTFFTDFVDPLATGTIPIYWGTRNVARHFNTDGIIFFDTLEELDNILSNLTEEDYYCRIEAVRDNFERAKEFWRSDDQLAKKIYEVLREK